MNGDKILGTVIIVNYNGGAMLLAALRSVLAQTIADRLEIVLVDNASTDDSVALAQQAFPGKVRMVRSAINKGFAGGNNLGFGVAQGKYLLLLNNDAVASPEWAERLIAAAQAYPSTGMCTPKILCLDKPDILDNAGHWLYADGLNRSRGHHEKDGPEYAAGCETIFASGCAGLYDRAAVERAGGFDEDFFAYGDDADLGLKLRLQGLECRYVPEAVVHHRQSASSGAHSLRKFFWIERNRIWIMLKYLPWMWIMASPWATACRLWGAYRAGRRGDGLAGELTGTHGAFRLAMTLFVAWGAALWMLPCMLRKRGKLARIRTVEPAAWRDMLKRFAPPPEAMTFAKSKH